MQAEVLQMPLPHRERLCVCCRAPCVKAFCSVDCGRAHMVEENCPCADPYEHGLPPADAPFDDSVIYSE